MALNSTQCGQMNSFLGSRPYDWQKKIAKDRKPSQNLYPGMYKTETYPVNFGTTMLHERVYANRANDPGIWTQFVADPCVGTPCDRPRQFISHGVDQLRFDRYKREYQTDVFCLDQLSTIEEAPQKIAAIVEGYKKVPEEVCSSFLRALTLRRAGTQATGSGLFLAGVSDSVGNPVAIDIADNMFTVSTVANTGTAGRAGLTNALFINLNANTALTALSLGTTTLLRAAMGQLNMEYLLNAQEDLASNGYHDREWMVDGKFSITTDVATRRRLMNANPALTQMYSAADFAKGGTFYSYGVTNGCGDWLFKPDYEQMRFIFRGDLDGKDLVGGTLANSVWIQQVWPYENIAATYGSKPVFSQLWKTAPIRMYHAYNREARTIYVGDVQSVNNEMKFGLARSFMGDWHWKSPDVIITTDPSSGVQCTLNNDLHNKGYWVGEFDLTIQTVYPECERVILALGEAQQFMRTPNTNTPSFGPPGANTGPGAGEGYQSLLAYNLGCYQSVGWSLPPED